MSVSHHVFLTGGARNQHLRPRGVPALL
jgi:hypothetical protein